MKRCPNCGAPLVIQQVCRRRRDIMIILRSPPTRSLLNRTLELLAYYARKSYMTFLLPAARDIYPAATFLPAAIAEVEGAGLSPRDRTCPRIVLAVCVFSHSGIPEMAEPGAWPGGCTLSTAVRATFLSHPDMDTYRRKGRFRKQKLHIFTGVPQGNFAPLSHFICYSILRVMLYSFTTSRPS